MLGDQQGVAHGGQGAGLVGDGVIAQLLGEVEHEPFGVGQQVSIAVAKACVAQISSPLAGEGLGVIASRKAELGTAIGHV